MDAPKYPLENSFNETEVNGQTPEDLDDFLEWNCEDDEQRPNPYDRIGFDQ